MPASTTRVGLIQALGRSEMTQPSKDRFFSWTFFLMGSYLFARGAVGLYSYFTTGQTFFHRQKSIPFNLDGSDAALMYSAFFVIGVLCIASGVKGLLSK